MLRDESGTQSLFRFSSRSKARKEEQPWRAASLFLREERKAKAIAVRLSPHQGRLTGEGAARCGRAAQHRSARLGHERLTRRAEGPPLLLSLYCRFAAVRLKANASMARSGRSSLRGSAALGATCSHWLSSSSPSGKLRHDFLSDSFLPIPDTRAMPGPGVGQSASRTETKPSAYSRSCL